MFSWFERRLSAYPTEEPTQPPSKILPFLWHYTRPVWPWLVLMSCCSTVIAIGEVTLFRFLGEIVDWLGHAERASFLATEGHKLLGMALVIMVVLPVVAGLNSLVIHQVLMGNFPMIARWQMHRFLLRHSVTFFANEFAGRVATKVMQTSLSIRETVMKLLDVFVYVVTYFISMVALVASADIRLAAPLAVWLLCYGGTVAYFVPRLRRVSSEQADARSVMTGRVVDSYTNIATVKLFSHASREEGYARDAMGLFLGTVYRQMRLGTSFQVLVYFFNCLALFSVGGLSIWFWLQGDISIGAIAIAIGLAMRINGMSQWVMWEVSALFENIGTVYDGLSMMKKPHDVTDRSDATKLIAGTGRIRFENIRFHYGKQQGIIDDLSLEIAPGEKVGIVGRSGAGKTTLMNLLLRFYDLEGGRIVIDGQDISTVTQDSLRAMIGVVTQDTSLLHRSIRDNIAYGLPDASDDQIIAAATAANAWSFVTQLSDQQGRLGLDAHVGERGVKLSGGQRQRIAIARVFLKDAPILVLDEATSALDSEVEQAIQENLFALMAGKTVLAIAHRLSTLTNMDRLIVLDKGRIVEAGTHRELIKAGGIYADLWNRQSGGFLADDAEAQFPASVLNSPQ